MWSQRCTSIMKKKSRPILLPPHPLPYSSIMCCPFETLHEPLGFSSFNCGLFFLRGVRVTDFWSLISNQKLKHSSPHDELNRFL